MVFYRQENIAYQFQKTCFSSCLLKIAFRKKNLAYSYSPLFQSFSECAVSGVCSFNANKLLPIDQ